LEACDNVTVSNITAPGTGTGIGVKLQNVSNSVFTGITVSNRLNGIGTSGGTNPGNAFLNNVLTGNNTGLGFHGDNATVSGNDLSNNNTQGLFIRGNGSTVGPDNWIANNGNGVVSGASTGMTITGNVIAGNTVFGVKNTDNTVVIAAQSNFWGHNSGPLDTDVPVGGLNDLLGLSNPDGQGDAVTDFVDYYPFATAGVAVENLIGVVEDLTDPVANGLVALLEQILHNIDTNPNAARGQLRGFIRMVENSQIDPEIAAALIERAAAIRDGL
jgi:hypothetical protein